MQKDDLQQLLAEVCGTSADTEAFEIDGADRATLLLATDGALEGIEGVTKLQPRQGYLRVEINGGAEVLWVGLERVAGIRLRRAKREGAGFVV
jgi:hypothetical protein